MRTKFDLAVKVLHRFQGNIVYTNLWKSLWRQICQCIVRFSIWQHLSWETDEISHYLLVNRLVRDKINVFYFSFNKPIHLIPCKLLLNQKKENRNKTKLKPLSKLIKYFLHFPSIMFEDIRTLFLDKSSRWKSLCRFTNIVN